MSGAEDADGEQTVGLKIGEWMPTRPITDGKSKRVMLRAERRDTIRLEDGREMEVQERQHTYHGYSLVLVDGETTYRLEAPGIDAQLVLWQSVNDDDGFRKGWRKVDELTAELVDSKPYMLCENCGEPIKSLEHERLAVIGACPA